MSNGVSGSPMLDKCLKVEIAPLELSDLGREDHAEA
jgi:hypothetical protein